MKGIFYDLKLWKAILKKMKLVGKTAMLQYREDWPVPEPKRPNEIQAKTIMSGICGTDMHMIDVNISYATSILASPLQPFPMGHELVARVSKIGENVKGIYVGDRVVYNPLPFCEACGVPPCASCQQGHWETCSTLAGVPGGSPQHVPEHLKGIGGFGGGGWSEYLVAFEKQFFRVPENIPDDVAVLTEPFSIGIHAAMGNLPKDDEIVLVIGGGIIGLMTIAAIRALGSKARILVVARHRHQAEWAMKLGANEIINETMHPQLYEKVSALTEGTLFKPTLGAKILFSGVGPDVVFDCVGSDQTLSDSLHLVRCNGTLVIVGIDATVTKKVDWALGVYKEVSIITRINQGVEEFEGHKVPTFQLALDLLVKNPSLFMGLVTHKFPINEYQQAFRTQTHKGQGHPVKITFDFSLPAAK